MNQSIYDVTEALGSHHNELMLLLGSEDTAMFVRLLTCNALRAVSNPSMYFIYRETETPYHSNPIIAQLTPVVFEKLFVFFRQMPFEQESRLITVTNVSADAGCQITLGYV